MPQVPQKDLDQQFRSGGFVKRLCVFYRMFFFSITLYSGCSVHYINIRTKVLLQVKPSEQRVSEAKCTVGNIDKRDGVALFSVFAFHIS